MKKAAWLALLLISLSSLAFAARLETYTYSEAVQSMWRNFEARGYESYHFDERAPESKVMSTILRRAGVSCRKVVGGTMYPTSFSRNIDADVKCGGNLIYAVGMELTRGGKVKKLFINGERIMDLKPLDSAGGK